MNWLAGISILIVSIVSTGCSQKQAYHGVRANQKSECQRIEDPDRYRDCMDEADQSYEDYQREREILIKEKSTQ
ncbi:hypothetical protein DU002_05420 [Corallincola holothuriorum]|uniref:Uncharacterized protein n=1 Tax=Corallincola holothuriorum TaxID=2282215 RepID=A0A368NPS3_9GAMM|nr:hypothetical protein [Corallincola holothuriorum]RCU51903.1 hypothetical protein DU002_05420 [Corallincola holothuriorum]